MIMSGLHLKIINILFLLCLSISLTLCVSPDGKCRALAMRGGGSKGAYELGVLKGLIKNLDPSEYRYDVVVGVSVGAINAAVIGIHEPGEEKEAIRTLEEIWTTYLP